ncbi:MAG: hypothetical protein C0404_11270 [Verrucomicrobia bacterium]|nr:hypothetical protein [Verrucomicrobiota bacterium]
MNVPPKDRFLRFRVRPWGLLASAGLVASIATLLGFLGRFGWFADLFSNFRVQYFIGLAVVAVLVLIPRWRKMAVCFGVIALVNLGTIVPLYLGRPPEQPKVGQTQRAMLINVNTARGDANRVAAAIRQYNPDILVLEEVSERWIGQLESATSAYAFSRIVPRDDNFGIALFSKHPFIFCDVVVLSESGVPSIFAALKTPSGTLTVLATHPVPPAGGEYSRWRNQQLAKIPELTGLAGKRMILLGDLNATPWSHHFRQLVRRSGLIDSAQGRGFQPTWPTHNPLLFIPIDHCLHSRDIQITNREIGPNVGSDHYPLVIDWRL